MKDNSNFLCTSTKMNLLILLLPLKLLPFSTPYSLVSLLSPIFLLLSLYVLMAVTSLLLITIIRNLNASLIYFFCLISLVNKTINLCYVSQSLTLYFLNTNWSTIFTIKKIYMTTHGSTFNCKF